MSMLQKVGAEAIVTIMIAITAVLVATVSFRTHVQDFETLTNLRADDFDSRLDAIELREREVSITLSRLDTHVLGLREDIKELKQQNSLILTKLTESK